MSTFNIYCASYKRADKTKVHELLEYCTFVVRKSEEEAYRNAGVESIWAIDDDKICSFAKVQNYIIENAPEDVVCVLDDDIPEFRYVLDKSVAIRSKEIATRELERLGQIMIDLDVGLLGSRITADPKGYHREINFSGMIGPIRFYNRAKVKSRYKEIKFFGDTDFVLQELLNNRIILRPNYFAANAKLETNKGGMNITRTKHIQSMIYADLRKVWGNYLVFDTKRNVTKVNVRR